MKPLTKCLQFTLINCIANPQISSVYTTKGEMSSICEEFLAVMSKFDSDHGVDFSAPTCCQSTTFVQPLFAFIVRCFLRKKNAALHFMPRMNIVFALDVATALRQINR